MPRLQTLDVPVMLDRIAMTPAATPGSDAGLQRLHDPWRICQAYIKLSTAHRIGGTARKARHLAPLFFEARLDRALWASD